MKMKVIWTDATPGQLRAFRLAVLNIYRAECAKQATWQVFGGVIKLRGLTFQVCSA